MPGSAANNGSWWHGLARRHSSTRPSDEQVLLRLYRILDMSIALGILLIASVASGIDRMPEGLGDFLSARLTVKNLLLIAGVLALWRFFSPWFGLYEPEWVMSRRQEALRVLSMCSLISAVAVAFPIISGTGAFRYGTIAYFWIGTTATLLSVRYGLRALALRKTAATKDVIIVGSGPRASQLSLALGNEVHRRYRLLGFVDSRPEASPEAVRGRMLGSLDDLDRILMRQVVDEVLIALPIRSQYTEIQRTIEICEEAGVRVKYLADAFRVSVARPSYGDSDQLPVVTMQMVADDYRLLLKRVIDVGGAVVALILLSPIMLFSAVAIKLTSPGPIFFVQERYGLNKRRIAMYKFRTMVVDAEARMHELEDRNEATGAAFKIREDPRITRVGRVLRRLSIDELPQLWNVLRGEMSLVGPRPMSLRDVALFSELALMRRFSVVPGMTGLWQVSGRSNLSFDEWIALDLAYIDTWSLGLDLKILLRTPRVVLTADGAA
ncbi:MAG: sugar transferase [Gemmatimonadales bacterium]